ncbi:MAG TPA: YceH family protein [Candidatus Acidoferrales bacterium]|nr:YceH family protein [Candidatus Acidoferrales bacterium]
MEFILSHIEVRVLGALLEKQITTPEYYPLSLNALVNACNQKSNREPVMQLDEDAVRSALRSLNDKGLAGPADTTDSRVTKYEHRLAEAFNFDRREAAVLCVLLLRGPQTPGEIRTRTDRMHYFDDLSAVQSALNLLLRREPPLVAQLSRQPGTKEARFAHLLSGELEIAVSSPSPASVSGEEPSSNQPSPPRDRVAELQRAVEELRAEVSELRRQFDSFRNQFQ